MKKSIIIIFIIGLVLFIGLKVILPLFITKEASDIHKEASNTVQSVDLDSAVTQSFNSKFTMYEGSNQGSTMVQAVITAVNSSNSIDTNKISIKFNGTLYSPDKISSISSLIKTTSKYSISTELNKSTQLVDTIIINEN